MLSHTRMGIPYAYGHPICIWASHMSTCMWDVPNAYGPIYAYGAEHKHPEYSPIDVTYSPTRLHMLVKYLMHSVVNC